MSDSDARGAARRPAQVRTERAFPRFTLPQRWEHLVLILSFTVLLLTGLPQKYFEAWGHFLLTTPESIAFVRQIHHIAAVVLILEVIYHLGLALFHLARRRLSAEIFPNWKDVTDAWQMLLYLLLIRREKPAFGKYNFEQKFTYWFLFLAIGIMVVTGIILWFPIQTTWVLPGGVIPAAHLAHSNEAIVATIFILIWHFYHVHFERLNISIFTGRLNESDMREYHALEYERLTGEPAAPTRGADEAPGREEAN